MFYTQLNILAVLKNVGTIIRMWRLYERKIKTYMKSFFWKEINMIDLFFE